MQSLCSAYHWPLSEAMKLTLPQVAMMNHAAWADHENSTRRFEAKKKWDEQRDIEDPVVPGYDGKRLSEIQEDSDMMSKYLSSDWSGT